MPKEKKGFVQPWNTESFDSNIIRVSETKKKKQKEERKRKRKGEKEKQGGLEVLPDEEGRGMEWNGGWGGKVSKLGGEKRPRAILIREWVSRLEADLINAHYAPGMIQFCSSFLRDFSRSERSVYPGYQLPPRNLSSLSRLN